jgi:hypothetical protein
MSRFSELLTAIRALEPYLTAAGVFVLALEAHLCVSQKLLELGCAVLLLAAFYSLLTIELA